MGKIRRITRGVPGWPPPLASCMVALGVATNVVMAQEGAERRSRRAGAGFFGIAGAAVEIGDLNRRLRSLGYATVRRTMLTLGGGGYGLMAGGILLGGEGDGLLSGEDVRQGRSISVRAGYGLVIPGYPVGLAPRLQAYPILGIGACALELRVGRRPTDVSFGDVLREADRQARLSRGSLLLSLGAGAAYRRISRLTPGTTLRADVESAVADRGVNRAPVPLDTRIPEIRSVHTPRANARMLDRGIAP